MDGSEGRGDSRRSPRHPSEVVLVEVRLQRCWFLVNIGEQFKDNTRYVTDP